MEAIIVGLTTIPPIVFGAWGVFRLGGIRDELCEIRKLLEKEEGE